MANSHRPIRRNSTVELCRIGRCELAINLHRRRNSPDLLYTSCHPLHSSAARAGSRCVDDGGRQDWTSPSCKGYGAHVNFKSAKFALCDLDPILWRGTLGLHASNQHFDRFRRFCSSLGPIHKQTDTHTTLLSTSIATGRIYTRRVGDAAQKPASVLLYRYNFRDFHFTNKIQAWIQCTITENNNFK